MSGFLLGTTMNKKVLKTMIALVIVFLLACYILKIFFPEQFVLSVENETIIVIGNYIDNTSWLLSIFGFLLGASTDYLYFGAVCKRKWIGFKLLSIIIIYNIFLELIYAFLTTEQLDKYANLITIASSCYMILIPMFFTKSIRELSITYTINASAQLLSLNIRDFSLLLTNVNTLIMFIFSLESYLWLLLLFLFFNYKKERRDIKWEESNHSMETNNELQGKSNQSTKRLNPFKKIGQFIKKNLTKSTIKKNLRKIKLAIKDFITDELWQYLIIFASIALCAWTFI